MAMDLIIKISDVRRVMNLIFDHIEKDLQILSAPIEEDYYWNIPRDEVYNALETPTELDMGQLYEDWEFLSKLKNPEDAPALMMAKLAPLIRYIGEKIGQ